MYETDHSIDREQLVASLQAVEAVSYAPRDDARDVDGRALLLAPHHVEPQPLLRLGQLHHAGVSMPFTGCKGCYSCLDKQIN